MKKKYLFALVLTTLALTACGNKKLVCKGSKNEEGAKSKITVTAKFDKKTGKYLNHDMDISMEFDKESDAKFIADNKDSFCSTFAKGDKAKCELKSSGKKITIKVRNAYDSSNEGKTKEDLKKEAIKDKNSNFTCK